MKAFRFAVISDTHFFAPGQGVDGAWWNRGLGSQSERIADSIIATVADLAPDFVIHCGDFTADSTMESYKRGCEIMDQLGCPWYAVPGNHDTWTPGVRAALRSRYSAQGEGCYHTKLINNVLFVFLDACFWLDRDGCTAAYLDENRYKAGEIEGMSFSCSQLQWLDDQLTLHADKPAILVSHTPLAHKERYKVGSLPKGKPTAKQCVTPAEFGLGDPGLGDEISNIIGKHANVRIALAGHWHINDVTVDRSATYCLTSSLREYPFEFRLIEMNKDGMSVATHGLNDKGLNDESFVAEWGNGWVTGTEADRTFQVTLQEDGERYG